MLEVVGELSELLQQLVHPLTLFCVLVVATFGLLAIGLMWRATGRAVRELNALQGALASNESAAPAASLWRARLRDLPDSRSLLVERPERVLDDWLQLNVLRLARFEAGSWITGTALFFTFLLIALVLANDVGPAIAGSGKENMASLARAVRTMGAKFIVSMLGIAMSIIHGFVRARCLRHLHSAVANAAHRLRGVTVSAGDFEIECAEWQVESGAALHRTIREQHGENAKRFDAIRESIESLKSIEVSVQDIGAELSSSMERMVKNDIVAGIRRDMQEVVDGLQAALTESFSANLSAQIALITDELRKIEGAVSSQAHSQVEDLLAKLSDLVSGGFASESSRMKEVLARFADVIPGLETQMREMSRSASEDLAQRSADSSRVNAELFDRLGFVLEGLERQQHGALEASSQMQQFVVQTQNMLANSMASANEQFSARSQGAMDQLTNAMRSATGSAADIYRAMVGEVEAAAKTLQQARTDASTGAAQLQEATKLMRDPLQRMNELIDRLRDTVSTLGASAQHARNAVESGSAVVKASAESIAQHQRFIDDLTARWPVLARQYLETSDQAFMKVAGSWKTQAEAIGTSVGRIGESFSSSAVEFADAVQELGEHIKRLQPETPSFQTPRTRG